MKDKYNTEQKKMIKDCLIENSNTFICAQDILNYLSNKNIQIGFTTIYRYLNYLEKIGVLRVETRKNTRYFQYIIEDCKKHYHLKCEKCGKIEHLNCDEMKKLCGHLFKTHKFSISQKSVIYGTCGLCNTK